MIAHMTTLHPRDDTRIRIKEAATLNREFGGVRLYVQDGLGDAVEPDGLEIVDTGPPSPRLRRMVFGCGRMIRTVLAAKPRVAHFHDPELLPWSMVLQAAGIKVVYDVHEDVPRQVRHNPKFRGWLQRALPPAVSATEWTGGLALSAMVAATPEIAMRFPQRKTVLVRNFPIVEELHLAERLPNGERPRQFAYVGGIGTDRGALQMVRALEMLDPPTPLKIAGSFAIAHEETAARAEAGWAHVDFLGQQDRGQVAELLASSRAGLVLFQPLPNNIAGRPNKLFEYMSAGLPVIASDYPRWREIVDDAGCGLLVDPTDPAAIANAMQRILDNPGEAEEMGRRGREAIVEKYSWAAESRKLLELYLGLLGTRAEER